MGCRPVTGGAAGAALAVRSTARAAVRAIVVPRAAVRNEAARTAPDVRVRAVDGRSLGPEAETTVVPPAPSSVMVSGRGPGERGPARGRTGTFARQGGRALSVAHGLPEAAVRRGEMEAPARTTGHARHGTSGRAATTRRARANGSSVMTVPPRAATRGRTLHAAAAVLVGTTAESVRAGAPVVAAGSRAADRRGGRAAPAGVPTGRPATVAVAGSGCRPRRRPPSTTSRWCPTT